MSDPAKQAYAIFQGGFRSAFMTPPHWDALEPWMRDAIKVAYFQGKLDAPDEIERLNLALAQAGDRAEAADAEAMRLQEQVRHLEHNLANIIRTG